MPHMLNARTLHDLAPGILNVVHGPDGDFEGAPMWRGPLYGPAYGYTPRWWYVEGFEDGDFVTADGVTAGTYMLDYDCRVLSVAARLLRLCGHASDTVETVNETEDLVGHLGAHMINIAPWHVEHAARVAALTLALAPKIAALGGSRV